MDKPLAAAKQHCLGLLLRRLRLHEAHFGLPRANDNCLSICTVILVTFHEGAYILRCDQLHLMAKRRHLPRPVAGAAKGFKNTRQAG